MLWMQWILWQALELTAAIEVPHGPEPALSCALLILGCVVTVGRVAYWLPPSVRVWGELPNTFPFLWEEKWAIIPPSSWWDDGPRLLLKGIIGPSLHPFSRVCEFNLLFFLLLLTLILHLLTLMKIQVSQKLLFFNVWSLLHLAEKSAWPWKAISQQRLWSLCISDLSRALFVLVCSTPSNHFLSLLSTIMMLMVILSLRQEWVAFHISSLKKSSVFLVGGSTPPPRVSLGLGLTYLKWQFSLSISPQEILREVV